jgi:hypothetical protein
MPGTIKFQFDDEERERVRDCLKESGTRLEIPFEEFIGRLEVIIGHFQTTEAKETPREARDSLMKIARLSREDDPRVGLLRIRLQSLPQEALTDVARRAHRASQDEGRTVRKRTFRTARPFHRPIFSLGRTGGTGRTCGRARQLSSDGGERRQGKSRGGEKRSADQLGLRVRGRVRGPGTDGRPSHEALYNLTLKLAILWHHATGQIPQRGRGDKTRFGKLFFLICELIHVPKAASRDSIDEAIEQASGAATYRLRRYWEQVDRGKNRPPLARAIGRRLEEIPANLRQLRERLAAITPAMAGVFPDGGTML